MPTLYNPFRKKGVFMIPAGGLGESVSAAFNYAKSSYHQDEPDPTPTITGTPGGSFNASAGLVFADTGTHNSTTGTIDLSASTIDSHIITYTVDGVQSGQTVGVTASPFISNTYSMQFDGVNDYVQTGGLTINNTFTFSCWLNVGSFSLANQCFLSSPNYYSAGFDGNFIIRLNNNTTINFYSYDGTGSGESITCTVPTISTGSWHHFALTNDGSTAQYYWDGSPITTTGVNTKGLDNLSAGLIIGDNITNNNNAFNGKIDEVSLWNTALGETAIQEIYNATNNNTGKALDLSTDYNNYTSSSNLQYWNRLGD